MDIKLPTKVEELFTIFSKHNYQLFIVGGAVRDLLLGRSVKDWDFTTNAKPEQILEVLPDGFYNNQFGTVGLSSKLGLFEITTMRKESAYKDSRHPTSVSWTDKIEEDLARRDFTINAIAFNIASQNLIDPFEGQKDLKSKLIKAVGDPEKRFKEDALRLIRAIRFATQLGFKIEDQTFFAVKKNKDLLKNISWERIRDELLKILSSENPYDGILLLRKAGLSQIILSELEQCFGIVQEGPKHDRIYDIGEHCLLSLKNCPSKDPIVRFATLIHDVGKVKTYKTSTDGNVTFYNHEIVGAKVAKEICQRLKFSKKDTEKVVTLVRWHMFALSENQTDSAIRRFIKNVGLENVDGMMALRVGDRLGGGTKQAVSWRMKSFRERINKVLEKPFSLTDLKVNGKDVMEILQIKPGPKVGKILNELFSEVQEDAEKNNREYLLGKIKQIN